MTPAPPPEPNPYPAKLILTLAARMDAFVAHPLSGFSEHIVADGYKRATQTD